MSEYASRYTIYDSRKKYNLFSYMLKMVRELRLYRYAYIDFVGNTLSTRYRRSALGFFWSLVSPLLNLTVLAVVFSLVFKRDIRVFGVYIFSGLSPWIFISSCLNQSPTVFIVAESYLKKVYIPKFIFPLTLVSVEGINFFFSMISIYILLLLVGAPLSPVMLLTPVAMGITIIFVLGLVLLLSVAHVYFRDVIHITAVVVAALMYTIPIFYPIESIPAKFQIVFLINPFFHFVNLFRIILYNLQVPTLLEWGIPLGIALISLFLGCIVLMKKDLDMVFRL